MKYYTIKNHSPKFCGLVTVLDYDAAEENPKLKEEYDYAYKYHPAGKPLPKISDWKPIRFRPYTDTGRKKNVADFNGDLIFSSRVVDALGDFFTKHGQFYPLIVEDYDDERSFFLYKCHTIIDCLDDERSEGWYDNPNVKHMTLVNKAYFNHEKIPQEVDIFNTPYGNISGIYVSERVRDALKTIKPPLTGFEFVAEGEPLFSFF